MIKDKPQNKGHIMHDETIIAGLRALPAGASCRKILDVIIAGDPSISDSKAYTIIQPAKVGRGKYEIEKVIAIFAGENVTASEAPVVPKPVKTPAAKVEMVRPVLESEELAFVPEKDASYVPWGYFKDVETIIASNTFFPVYIQGPSGDGKTSMVEQVCAKLKREFVRVQISPETDESDLIGSFRLQDGNTVFAEGPCIRAMRRGSVLLLDELDRGTNKILCCQSMLEGKPVLLKKTGEVVHPAPGFTVIATANTAGRGSDDGKYSGASIIDEAFLERFPIMLNQGWASKAVETRIIVKVMEALDCLDAVFAERLAAWSKIIRKTYEDDGIDDVISTRRLVHIVRIFSIFKDKMKAVTLGCVRFPPETSSAFVDLYTKIDQGVHADLEF